MSIYPPPSEPAVLPEYREPGERERSFLSLGLNDGQTLQHFLLIGKKYIWLVLTCALLGTGAGYIENATSPKEYRSTANIEITQDTADQFRVDTGGGYDSGYIDVTKLDTEIAILKSSTLAMQTIMSLHLDQNKDFLPLGSNHVWDLSKIQDRHALIGMFEAGSGGRALWTHQYSRPQLHGAQSRACRSHLQHPHRQLRAAQLQ